MRAWSRCGLVVGLVVLAALTARAQPVVWEQVGGEANIINGLAFDEADTLWAIGSARWDLQQMPPGSDTWIEVSGRNGAGLVFTDVGSVIVNSGSGLLRSTDRGRTFEGVDQPAGGGLYEVEGGPLAGRLFAGVSAGEDPNGAAFSTDDGQTWTHAPIRESPQQTFGGDAQAFLGVNDGPNAGRVVAACYNGLAYTDDGGLSWELSSVWEPFAFAAFSVVRLPPGSAEGGEGASGRRLLAAVDAACCPERIWASDDDGETWVPLAALDASAEHVRLLYVGATASGPETVYAVTVFSEVWRSGDGGETWEGLGNVYPEATTYVKDAVVGPDGRLYVAQNQAGSGAPSNGVWRTVAPVTVASEGAPAEVEASRLSVYPNPARGAATVALTLAEAGDVRAAVFDLLGREVTVLHDGRLAAGTHPFAIETAGWPAGAYVVRATGGVEAARRLTVVR
jgi:hypothetical protein